VRDAGAVAGVALNPSTPAEAVANVADLVDLVLVMTVNPGFGGQDYIATMEQKVAQVRAMLAVYCSRRTHLATLGLAIASTCERNELIKSGGQLGAVIFVQSRQALHVVPEKRRKVTLSSGSCFSLIVAQDLI